ncbi:MAG: EAL domain-containing protein [Gemmatimonadetes bacterium]|nr:EAL domain-containing protein [Gemmatimonadota bacterium]
MSPFLPLSFAALLAAGVWALLLSVKSGDGYRRALALVVAAVALGTAARQLVPTADVVGGRAALLDSVAALATGALAILALYLLDRIVARQRHVERHLEIQKAYLEDLLESSTDAIVLVDHGGCILRINGAFTELFGHGAREVEGAPLDDLLAFTDQLRSARAATRRMIAGDAVELESVRRRKDGTPIDVSVLGAPVRVPGEPAAAFVIFRDITRRMQVEAAFRRLEKAVETMQLGVTVTDLDGRIVYMNPAEAEMHGYAREELIGKDVRIFAVPGTAKRMTPEQIARIGTWRRESTNVHKDGSTFPVQLMSDVVRDSDGNPIGIVTTCEDITQRRLAERALHESEQRYALAVRGGNDGLWDWNLETGEVHYSSRWKAMLGYGEGEIGNAPSEWLERVHADDVARVTAELEAHRADRSPSFEVEHRVLHSDGSYRWVLARGIAERRPDGKPYRIAGSLTDITKQKGVEEQLAQEALYDKLTGLPNRAFLTDILNRCHLRMKRRKGYAFAVLFVDLDRFKSVNDGLGHAAGDRLLIEAGRRFQRCLRPGDVIARLSGDEFLILLDDLKDSRDASRVAERIQQVLDTPIPVDGREVAVSASIGIAVSGPGVEDPEQLIRNADSAMYRAKAEGKARFELYDRGMHERAIALLNMEKELREALRGGQLRLVYQPVVSLDTKRVTSFEALMRWEHPKRGEVPAEVFVPVAEETGLMVSMGRWALRRACLQMAEWTRRFPVLRDLSVSVNLSAKQLKQPDIVDQVREALREGGLEPNRLRLEIAESALLDDPDFAEPTVQRLRNLGVQVQIDDFGASASSLSYLSRFRIETLKIDRSFIRELNGSGDRTALVQAFITLARHLGIHVVAEGVETSEQLATLLDLNCEHAQGFLYSQPLEPNEVGVLLERETNGGAWH